MSTSGLFNINEDHLEQYQSLDARFIRNKVATFYFHMEGNSMKPLIMDRDVLIVDRSINADDKRVVIATLYGEMVCRRFIEIEEQVILRSENPLYKDIYVTQEMDMTVFGVVTCIVREKL